MNYCVSIGEHKYRINVQNNNLVIDGEQEQGHLIPLNTNGLHLLRRGARDVELHLQAQDSDTVEVLVGTQRVIARLESSSRRPRRQAVPAHPGTLTAPMPGMISSVQVAVNDTVEQGQLLMVMESMKMQMQMRAPICGRVTNVAVQPGTQVEKGAVLIQIDENSPIANQIT